MVTAILFGPPGAGKSTFAKKLIEPYMFTHISTGDIFRDHMARQTDLGLKIEATMKAGQLVSDDLVLTVVQEAIGNAPRNVLLDGFPRTLNQAQALDTFRKVSGVINLVVSDEELIARLLKRGRGDDELSVVQNRLAVYRSQSEPCLAYYRERGLVHDVNGSGTIDEVYARIIELFHARTTI